jgi:hypothetical protein
LIGRLNQTAADGVFPLSAFKPSSSDSADRGIDCAFVNLEDKYTFRFKEKQKVAV